MLKTEVGCPFCKGEPWPRDTLALVNFDSWEVGKGGGWRLFEC